MATLNLSTTVLVGGMLTAAVAVSACNVAGGVHGKGTATVSTPSTSVNADVNAGASSSTSSSSTSSVIE